MIVLSTEVLNSMVGNPTSLLECHSQSSVHQSTINSLFPACCQLSPVILDNSVPKKSVCWHLKVKYKSNLSIVCSQTFMCNIHSTEQLDLLHPDFYFQMYIIWDQHDTLLDKSSSSCSIITFQAVTYWHIFQIV